MLSPHPTSESPRGLLAWARVELRRRLEAGEPCRAESFLAEYPSLASDPDQAVDLILCEYRLRRERGETPDPEELLSRFPQWQDRLRRHFLAPLTDTAGATTPLSARAASRPPAEPGVQLGRLRLIEELGHGGMGVVYRAHDPDLDRHVAVKMLRDRFAGASALERFHREARALARIRHPHIIEIFAVGQLDGQPCFTMPLLAGSLAQKLDKGPLPPDAAASLLVKVAGAVHAAHEAGVIHRDLKAGNILLDRAGEPLVADFGLAKLAEGEGEPTLTFGLVGTPATMAPEQHRGAGVSKASDVWSLGVILYECLAGRRPFLGRGEELTQAILHAAPPPLRQLRPDLPWELEAILQRCLEKEPAKRYPSAGHLADDLARWRRDEAISIRPATWRRRAANAVVRSLRRPWVAAALALLVLVTAAGLSWRFLPAREGGGVLNPETERRRREALAAVYRDLEHGPVKLLDHNGQERWYRWASERDRPPMLPAVDGYRAIKAVDLVSQCELLPRTPPEGYRLSVPVQVTQRLAVWRAGMYFLGEEVETDEGRLYRYLTLHLSTQRAGNEAVVRFGLEHFREPNPRRASPPSRAYFLHKTVPLTALNEWHTLEAEVRPGTVTVFYDGKVLGTYPRTSLDDEVRGREKTLYPSGLPPLQRTGSIGLVVSDCSARFRDVLITPLGGQ